MFNNINNNNNNNNNNVIDGMSKVLNCYSDLLPFFRNQLSEIDYRLLEVEDLKKYVQIRKDFNTLIFQIDSLVRIVRPMLNIANIVIADPTKLVTVVEDLLNELEQFKLNDLSKSILAMINLLTELDISIQTSRKEKVGAADYLKKVPASNMKTTISNGIYLLATAYMTKISAVWLSSIISAYILQYYGAKDKAQLDVQKNENFSEALEKISCELNSDIQGLNVISKDISQITVIMTELKGYFKYNLNNPDFLVLEISKLNQIFDHLDEALRGFGYYYDADVILRNSSSQKFPSTLSPLPTKSSSPNLSPLTKTPSPSQSPTVFH